MIIEFWIEREREREMEREKNEQKKIFYKEEEEGRIRRNSLSKRGNKR